jgi:hypothetical protein
MPKPKTKQNPIILAVLFFIGMALFSLQAIYSIGPWFQSLTIKVEHPHDSTFVELDNLLKANVKNGRVNYQQLKNSPLLGEAMAKLARFSPDAISDPNERICFWLNAYNLVVIKLICDRYPIERVTQLGNDPNFKKVLVGGVPYSQQEIYLYKLVPLVKAEMPLALFLACGGAIGYPPLLDHSIKPASLESESESAAKSFINDPNNVGRNSAHNNFPMSPWFVWTQQVFAKKYGPPEELISHYLSPDLLKTYNKVTTRRSFRAPFNYQINKQ